MNRKRKREFTRKSCALLLAVCVTVFCSLPVLAQEPDRESTDESPSVPEQQIPEQPEDQMPPENNGSDESTPDTEPETESGSKENPREEDVSSSIPEQPEGQAPPENNDPNENTPDTPPEETETENQEALDPAQLDTSEERVIDVIVPPQGEMIINPYRLKIDADGAETREQIFNTPQILTNCGDFPVLVNVHVSGLIPEGSDVALVDHIPEPGTKEKQVFLYAEFQNVRDNWTGEYIGNQNQIVVGLEGLDSENVLTLLPKGEGYFRIFGAMAERPSSIWENTDTFDVALSFSFEATEGIEAALGTPDEPKEPTKPSDPAGTPDEPKEPTEPSNPAETPDEPKEPTEPSDPAGTPDEPKEPTEPSDPAETPDEPKEPTEPSDPAETPDEPKEPTEPSDPAETPDEPKEPTEPSDPAETPDGPEEPTEPTESEPLDKETSPPDPAESNVLNSTETQTQPGSSETVNPDTV